MKTAVRRDRILNLLHRGATTVPVIAQQLGVSERTAYRDISALRDAGHEIDATSGPGGGVRVSPSSRPRPVHFEVAEIIGLALSVAMMRATPHMPFASSAQAALDRARRALSSERQRAITRLQRRILVGSVASDPVQLSLGSVDSTLLMVFERCFTQGLVMTFDYVDRFGACSCRQIECVALILHAPAWYVVAWDLDKDARRMFRMDRISHPASGVTLTVQHTMSVLDELDCEVSAPVDWLGEPLG